MESALSFLKNKKEEIIYYLQKLIRSPTENPPGDVSRGIEVLREVLDRYDVSYKLYEPQKGKISIVAEIGEGDKTLILNGHIDVVPAGSGWSIDPYIAEIVSGRLYGRGATDMKPGLIALLYAFIANRKLSNGKLVFMAVPDEETGGKFGTEYLLKNGIVKGDACIIGEPSGELKARRYYITAGERGLLWVRITTKGKAAHGSLPMLGDNAIIKMVNIIQRIPMVSDINIMQPKEALPLIIEGKRLLEKKHPKASMALDHFTINIGVIEGGSKVNVVADQCNAELDIRIPIGASTRDAEELIRGIIGNYAELSILNRIEPSFTPASHELIRIAQKAGKEVLGYEPKPIAMTATSDARLFRLVDIPTINFGPGYLEVAHKPDEFVYIEDVLKFAKIYCSIINGFFKSNYYETPQSK